MAGIQLFNRNVAFEVDDSELVNSYDEQYKKVKENSKSKLPPIDSTAELSLNKKVNTNQDIQTESNSYQDAEFFFPLPDSFKNVPNAERKALSSMLMSYYMNGFHSGNG